MNFRFLSLGRLGKNSIFTVLEQFLNVGINFLIFILIARYWGVQNLGKFNIGLTLVGLISVITNFGISTIMSREISKSRKKTRLYLGSALGIKFLISFPLLLIFSYFYTCFFINDLSTIKLIFLIAINSTFLSGINYVGVALHSIHESQIFLDIVLKHKFILLLITIVLIKYNYSIIEFLFISICISIIIFLFSIQKIKSIIPDFRILYKSKFIKVYILISLPLVAAAFSEFINLRIDMLYIGFMLNEKSVGYYSAAFNIVLGSSLIPLALTKVYYPNFINYLKRNPSKAFNLLSKYILFYSIYSFLISLAFFLFSDILIKLIYGEEFKQSIKILKYLSICLLFLNLNRLFNYTLIALKEDKYFAKICTIGSFLNLFLNYFLILNFKIIGAAYATIITEFIIMSLGFIKINSLKTSFFLNDK
jgi:O-antigen/teichoic acid export membrane protein